MIPTYHIKIVQDLDSKLLELPPKIIKFNRELQSNLEFVNPTRYGWNDFEDIIPFEEAAIKKAKKSKTIDGFLDTLEEEQDYVDCGTIAELGVSGVVIALVNSGYLSNKKGKSKYNCIPVTSCVGSYRLIPSHEDETGFYPHVAGFATPLFGGVLLNLVKSQNVGLRNIDFVEGPGFLLYAKDIEELFDFGKFLYAQKDSLQKFY